MWPTVTSVAMITAEEWSSARRSKLPRVSRAVCIASVLAVVASSTLGGDLVLKELLVEDALSAFHKEKYF